MSRRRRTTLLALHILLLAASCGGGMSRRRTKPPLPYSMEDQVLTVGTLGDTYLSCKCDGPNFGKYPLNTSTPDLEVVRSRVGAYNALSFDIADIAP